MCKYSFLLAEWTIEFLLALVLFIAICNEEEPDGVVDFEMVLVCLDTAFFDDLPGVCEEELFVLLFFMVIVCIRIVCHQLYSSCALIVLGAMVPNSHHHKIGNGRIWHGDHWIVFE